LFLSKGNGGSGKNVFDKLNTAPVAAPATPQNAAPATQQNTTPPPPPPTTQKN
jgi:hypothetical protein